MRHVDTKKKTTLFQNVNIQIIQPISTKHITHFFDDILLENLF